jgi:hypothetical protein
MVSAEYLQRDPFGDGAGTDVDEFRAQGFRAQVARSEG